MLLRRLLLASLGLVALGLSAGSTADDGKTPAAPPVAPETPRLAADESLQVDPASFSARNFNWTDASRGRSVPARLYLPAHVSGAASTPLVVFSHGIGGSRDGYSYLGRYFAANGYASLHVQHVGSDRQVWFGNPLLLVSRLATAAQEGEALSRVQDMTFALDQLLASPDGAVVDTRRIAAAGHSYGANTTMLIAGARVDSQGSRQSLRDPRISSAILLSAPPFYGLGDPVRILAGIDMPTLHITATGDTIQIPGYYSGYEDRVSLFKATGTDRRTHKVLAVFKDGSHSMFTDRAGTGGMALNPQVKVATRQLALAFLNRVYARDGNSLLQWPQTYRNLLAAFETASGPAAN
jgi:predicted dienelactone hydrolase